MRCRPKGPRPRPHRTSRCDSKSLEPFGRAPGGGRNAPRPRMSSSESPKVTIGVRQLRALPGAPGQARSNGGRRVSSEPAGGTTDVQQREIRGRRGWRHGCIPKTPSASAWRWGLGDAARGMVTDPVVPHRSSGTIVTRIRCGEIEPTGLNLAQRLDNEPPPALVATAVDDPADFVQASDDGRSDRLAVSPPLTGPGCGRSTSGGPPRRPGARGRGRCSGAGIGDVLRAMAVQ